MQHEIAATDQSLLPLFGYRTGARQTTVSASWEAPMALQPLTGRLSLLDPASLTRDGQIEVATMESAPTDGAVLPQVRSAADQFTEELTCLQSNASTVVRVGDRPIHDLIAQFHLPNGAEVENVMINGREWSALIFEAQGRPAAAVGVTLQPRETVQVQIVFTEPASDGPGAVTVQPLASEQLTQLGKR